MAHRSISASGVLQQTDPALATLSNSQRSTKSVRLTGLTSLTKCHDYGLSGHTSKAGITVYTRMPCLGRGNGRGHDRAQGRQAPCDAPSEHIGARQAAEKSAALGGRSWPGLKSMTRSTTRYFQREWPPSLWSSCSGQSQYSRFRLIGLRSLGSSPRSWSPLLVLECRPAWQACPRPMARPSVCCRLAGSCSTSFFSTSSPMRKASSKFSNARSAESAKIADCSCFLSPFHSAPSSRAQLVSERPWR